MPVSPRRKEGIPSRFDAVEHSYHLIGGLHVGENPSHCPEFGLMRGPINFGHGIADHDHPIIVFDPTPDGRRHTDASGHPASDTGGYAHIAENRIEGSVREPTKAFLRDQLLAFLGLQVIDDLRAPRPLHAMRAVAAA